MGCLTSKEAEVTPEKARNTEIEQQIRDDKLKMDKEVKMLLLGTGESGKSTILKQMQLIHGVGFSDADRVAIREVVINNLLQSMQAILDAMSTRLQLDFADKDKCTPLMNAFVEGSKAVNPAAVDPGLVAAIKGMLADEGVKTALARAKEYQLNDSAKYYFEHIDRITQPGFTPTDQDILRSRVKTTGIVENTFIIDNLTFRMFDVGGQRSERKKWIHCFENVTAIVYMAALSEYDQRLFEDESQNRMKESLQLFSSICNSRWFTKTSMILFLNKIDLFREKILVSPIEIEFPEYEGGPRYDLACAFFQEKFEELNQSESKEVYIHLTCATDTTQIRFVMAAVRDIVMKNNLVDAGLL
ncbi:guanine nucleotide-binding protein G(o) subunit alpha-like protein [Catenaria anguillulae PL171]|uniref:Guanine nucleotide-binding protein G(O) subunit alpha-like protein n=1 Tax=Catenaria anguillulae PL171 TaxID=765915 RepID=A0A1Y2HI37_9FUNG|nr:guanine nucleotide-binding protein G(o) subunit alpha-like protein [Catenaria anguillulae PL171]